MRNLIHYLKASRRKIWILLKLESMFCIAVRKKEYDLALNLWQRIERIKHTI